MKPVIYFEVLARNGFRNVVGTFNYFYVTHQAYLTKRKFEVSSFILALRRALTWALKFLTKIARKSHFPSLQAIEITERPNNISEPITGQDFKVNDPNDPTSKLKAYQLNLQYFSVFDLHMKKIMLSNFMFIQSKTFKLLQYN